jgi:hypothetical protein
MIERCPEGHPQVLTIMHLELGWPIVIDQGNYALLGAYDDAAERDHPLHLVSLSVNHTAAARWTDPLKRQAVVPLTLTVEVKSESAQAWAGRRSLRSAPERTTA